MQTYIVPIKGMHCKSCEMLIEENVGRVPGVKKVQCSHVSGRVKIWYEDSKPAYGGVCRAVEDAGYRVGREEAAYWFSRNFRDYYYVINAAAILLVLYILWAMSGLSRLADGLNSKSIVMAGAVGLVAGVSSCMALIGGLVLAFSARHAELHPEAGGLQKFRPHLFFNLGRVVGFSVFGGVIGLAGGIIQPSVKGTAVLSLLVSAVMILLGLKLMDLFPILQKINISLPKSVARMLGMAHGGTEYSHAAAAFSGAATFFLPCGFTQAMQLYAISTGSFFQGAAIMALFALGTVPGLLGIGGLTSAVKASGARLFFSTAGLAVVLLGIFNISNAGGVLLPAFGRAAAPAAAGSSAMAGGHVQEIRMTQSATGYSPNFFTVKKGIPVKWVINSTNQFTCASYVSMPAMGILRPLKAGENIIEFTPTQAGELAFSCSMGMYRGRFMVTD